MIFYRRFHCKHGDIPSFLAQLFTLDLLGCHSIPTRFVNLERATRRLRTKPRCVERKRMQEGGDKLLLVTLNKKYCLVLGGMACFIAVNTSVAVFGSMALVCRYSVIRFGAWMLPD
jgi:hypothetical protein